MSRWESTEGSPIPLGATWITSEDAYSFAFFETCRKSHLGILRRRPGDAGASLRVRASPEQDRPDLALPIPQTVLAGAKFYAYQIDGPKPGPGFAWHTFDPEKLLLDPYARNVHFSRSFDREAARRPVRIGAAPRCPSWIRGNAFRLAGRFAAAASIRLDHLRNALSAALRTMRTPGCRPIAAARLRESSTRSLNCSNWALPPSN